ncbi:MAG: 16S rRNA (cytidine(1402)-2'-O)-methyltransferase [Spirochaetales bacterium]
MSGTLYFVATPIGNMGDITKRAIDTLNGVNVILCEDTRHSAKLLNLLEIKKPLQSFHKFNYAKKIPEVINLLKEGQNIALITDAGTPAISDPGAEIIEELVKNDIKYTIIPGATASINAFILSGFKTTFTFVGFLPEQLKQKEEVLKELINYKSALIFYSAPHNLNDDIAFLFKHLGNRKLVVVRELTKMYEEILHTTLEEGYTKEPKGEFALVVEGKTDDLNELNNLTIAEHIEYYTKLKYTKNEAIKQVAKDRNVTRQEIYNKAIK